MKKILLFLFLGFTSFVNAQNFEGIISWKITTVITDPKIKAQMEEAKKKMSDPATQAQMKEMKEKMNDPQMKAMMEANPQMKAQMEAVIKMAEGGGGLESMMPKGYIMKMKDQNVHTIMEGGGMGNMEILFLKAKVTAYKIDREAKTYSPLPKEKEEASKDPNKPEVKVTKTSETAKILGYTCVKYVAESTTKDQTMKQFFWTTEDIDFDLKGMGQQRMGQQSLFYDQIEGVPLKIEIAMPQGNMLMEATEVKKQSLPSSEFLLPVGFKEVPFKVF